MSYVFLLLSALLDALKSCLSKNLSRFSVNLRDSLILNLFRTLLCVVCGCVMVSLTSAGWPRPDKTFLMISLLSGISMAVFMVSWLLSLRTGALMTLTVLGSASNLIPVVLTFVCFGEPIMPAHLLGLFLFLIASVLLCSYNKKLNGRMSPKAVLSLSLMFLSCGMTAFIQKLFVYTVPEGNTAFFNLLTYAFASLILGIILTVTGKNGGAGHAGLLWRKSGRLIIIMSVSLFFVDFLRTRAAVHIPAGILYPMSSGIVLFINQLYSIFVIKEKPAFRELAGILLALAGMIVINM